MSNLEDIQQVVALAANELWHELAACAPDRDAEELAIARAIMAAKAEEREACAEIASNDGGTAVGGAGNMDYGPNVASRIAAAIRKRGDG